MAAVTSSRFASVLAKGHDWRDCSKSALEQLGQIRTENDGFNFGFLYISDELAEDMESIVNLFKGVTNIENWVGSVGIGVCGNNELCIDRPAISVMITRFDDHDFEIFGLKSGDDKSDLQERLENWLGANDPMLILTHGDPMAEPPAQEILPQMTENFGGFIIGGLSSSRKKHAQIAGHVVSGGMSGVLFSDSVPVATTLSQACSPMGKPHLITKGQDHLIYELDGQKALDVLNQDLRSMVIKSIDKDPDEVMIDEMLLDSRDTIPEEYRTLFSGQVHIAFPNTHSDQKDYLVRNIIGADQDEGSVAVSQIVCSGEKILFVRRNSDILRSDLIESLNDLKSRIEKQEGHFSPKGALYISCVARAVSEFTPDKSGDAVPEHELEIIQSVIGDIPLTGFYASGEICNAQLYGYTGILTLFL